MDHGLSNTVPCLNNWWYFLSFLTVAPSEIQISVDNVAVQGSTMLLQRGIKVSLRCETRAEPSPSFSWIIPGRLEDFSSYGPSWVSGIKWQHTLIIRSMNCLSSGNFQCLPKNVVSEQSSSVAIRVTGLFVTRIALAYQFNKTHDTGSQVSRLAQNAQRAIWFLYNPLSATHASNQYHGFLWRRKEKPQKLLLARTNLILLTIE